MKLFDIKWPSHIRNDIDKAITLATHNVMLQMVEKDLQSNVKMLVEVDGEFVVNAKAVRGIGKLGGANKS